MRGSENDMIDPDVVAALDAIDAVLAGEPVDPEHAEAAELALQLVAARPQIDPVAARSLDERRSGSPRDSGGHWRWVWKPLTATTAVAAAIAVVLLTTWGGDGNSGAPERTVTRQAASSSAAAASSGAAASPGSPASSSAVKAGSPPGVLAPSPQPFSSGRNITQSAQLSLSTAPGRVDDVAQALFNVIGAENGVVDHSTVTATGGADGYAEFQLTVPSASLSRTMAELSRLRYANVVSRTDTTQNLGGQVIRTRQQLVDAQALRASLMKQLANALTTGQTDGLNGRIHDAEATIARAQAALRSLGRRVDDSQISVQINASPLPIAHGSSGFTVGKAARDAGRVLTVGAGVTLIALAVLAPLALLAGLAWWVVATLRRRQRGHALDVV